MRLMAAPVALSAVEPVTFTLPAVWLMPPVELRTRLPVAEDAPANVRAVESLMVTLVPLKVTSPPRLLAPARLIVPVAVRLAVPTGASVPAVWPMLPALIAKVADANAPAEAVKLLTVLITRVPKAFPALL